MTNRTDPLPRRLFSLGEDGELKIWTLDQRRKPRTVPVGRNASALALFDPNPQAKPEQRGGTLVAVTEDRQIWLSTGRSARQSHRQSAKPGIRGCNGCSMR
jgi:hypothetical protein